MPLPAVPLPRLRPLLVLVHRWVGLVMAGFLLLAGLTGALLVWNQELDAAISPQLFHAPAPAAGARPIDPLVLREQVQARHPQAQVAMAPLAVEPGRTLKMWLSAAPGQAAGAELPNDQVFVDPYTGRVLGERKWGEISQGWKNLMPFIYRLHYSLALGVVGSYAFGVVALLWTLDCFAGAYLTFPAAAARRKPGQGGGKPWLARWWPSWKLRWGSGSYKLNFDLHRAGGLWVWAMLFVLAWSSVAFNLSQVYDPVMKAAFAHQPDDYAHAALPVPRPQPAIGWHQARDIGRRLMDAQAREKGFVVVAEDRLMHDPSTGIYHYSVRSSRDVSDHWGSTRVGFDADTGALKSLWLPTGEASGDTLRTWLTSLHMAVLWGLPFRVFVTLMGLVVAMLSITGVVVWWKKRQGRLLQARREVAGERAPVRAAV